MINNIRLRGRSLPSKPTTKKNGRCFFWALTGHCRNGSLCAWRHFNLQPKKYMPKHADVLSPPPITNIGGEGSPKKRRNVQEVEMEEPSVPSIITEPPSVVSVTIPKMPDILEGLKIPQKVLYPPSYEADRARSLEVRL